MKLNIYNKKTKSKLYKRLTAVALASTMAFTTACSLFSKKNSEYETVASSYIQIQNENNDSFFNDSLEQFYNEASNIDKYIDVAEKLEKLDLSEYNISWFDYEVEFLKPNEVLKLIDKFKELKNETKGSIGDEVVELNDTIYVLKEQEKLYNQKLYNSYGTLSNYAECLAKSFVAEKYDIDEPASIEFEYKFENADGMYHGNFTYDGEKTILSGNDSDIQAILKLVATSEKMNYQKEDDINKIQSYNADRIELLEDTYNKINKLSAHVIEENEKEFLKGNQK